MVSTGVRAGLISLYLPRIRVHGRVRFSGPLPDFMPPSFNGSGHHATNVETGVQILSGVPRLRARAAKRIGHQPPKLAICEFESHRAFHAGLI